MIDGNERFLALLPAYNEAAHLEQVLKAVKEQIRDILVVDDGSKDNTAEIARGCGVELLSRGYNCGKGQSLRDGYSWALEHDYDAVIMLDSDGHRPRELIPDQNTGVGSLSFLQGIFPTQGSNPSLPQCRRILYHLSHQGGPIIFP